MEISQETINEVARVSHYWPDGVHTREELAVLEPGRRPDREFVPPHPDAAEHPVDGPRPHADGVRALGHSGGVAGRDTSPSVNGGGTDTREDGKVRCANFAACGNWCGPRNKTGRCVGCMRDMWRTGELSHPRNDNPRKTDPAERAAMLTRMLTAAARRAVAEDPGQGLVIILRALAQLEGLAKTVGIDLLAQFMDLYDDGLSAMASDLTASTGETWSRQRVHNRWAAKQRGQVPADV